MGGVSLAFGLWFSVCFSPFFLSVYELFGAVFFIQKNLGKGIAFEKGGLYVYDPTPPGVKLRRREWEWENRYDDDDEARRSHQRVVWRCGLYTPFCSVFLILARRRGKIISLDD